MADTKISQLPAATTPLSGAEVVPLVQSGATVQTPANEVSKLVTQLANTFTQDQTFSAAAIVGAGNDQVKASVSGTTSSVQWGAPSVGGHFKIAYSRSLGSATITTGFLASPITTIVTDAGGNVGIGTSLSLGTYGKLRVGGTGYQALNVGSDDGSGVNMIVAANAATEGRVGTVTNHPVDFYTNGAAKARLDASGNLLITSSGGLGYGTGSGGTVTQLTSKSTGVTLNKTNGQITMNAAALANGASVAFNLTNSTISSTDLLLTNCSSNSGYTITCTSCTVGSANIRVTNVSGGSLSEALVINFAVIKAVTS